MRTYATHFSKAIVNHLKAVKSMAFSNKHNVDSKMDWVAGALPQGSP